MGWMNTQTMTEPGIYFWDQIKTMMIIIVGNFTLQIAFQP